MSPHQQMIDEADIFCRNAKRFIEREDWKAAAAVLLARVKALDMALQSLTPGGSEYVADPERCVARVRDQMNTYRELWRDAVAKNRS